MPERKPYIAYPDDLSEFVVFEWEITALHYAVKHRWNVKALRFQVGLREQLASTVVGPAEPADDDVVDAEIDYSEAYTELAEMRLAVLAIHKPCHSAISDNASCHAPNAHAECMGCGYGDLATLYPCPTAQALGVTA